MTKGSKKAIKRSESNASKLARAHQVRAERQTDYRQEVPVPQPELSTREIVRQSWLIHPEWDAATHLGYLEWEEFRDPVAELGDNPAAVIEGWLAEWRTFAANHGIASHT